MKKLNNWEETDDAKLKQKAYEFILENIVSLRDNNKPLNNAPNRDVMPQTDGGENFTKKKITQKDNEDIIYEHNKNNKETHITLPAIMSRFLKSSLKMDLPK